MGTLHDLQAAVEAAQQQTDGHLATARSFAWLAQQLIPRVNDLSASQDSRDMASKELALNLKLAKHSKKDHRRAALTELAARRELDEARKTEGADGLDLAAFVGACLTAAQVSIGDPMRFRPDDAPGNRVLAAIEKMAMDLSSSVRP